MWCSYKLLKIIEKTILREFFSAILHPQFSTYARLGFLRAFLSQFFAKFGAFKCIITPCTQNGLMFQFLGQCIEREHTSVLRPDLNTYRRIICCRDSRFGYHFIIILDHHFEEKIVTTLLNFNIHGHVRCYVECCITTIIEMRFYRKALLMRPSFTAGGERNDILAV